MTVINDVNATSEIKSEMVTDKAVCGLKTGCSILSRLLTVLSLRDEESSSETADGRKGLIADGRISHPAESGISCSLLCV